MASEARSDNPIWAAIARQIKLEIASRKFEENDRLPSERDLCARHSSTRITVRAALARLESEGLIYRVERRGWFVAPRRLLYPAHKATHFTKVAREQGFAPTTQVVSVEQTTADSQVAAALALEVGQPVHWIRRLRLLDTRPVVVESLYLSAMRFHGLADVDLTQPLTETLKVQFGAGVSLESIWIQPTVVTEWRAECLSVADGTAAVRVIRKRYDAEGAPVQFDLEYWLNYAVEFRVDAS